MHILLTNDDGIFAPGLAAIYKRLAKLGKVTVVAPAKAKSGASHSITLAPLTCQELEITGKFTGYSVDGSPADCVKLAVMEILKDQPVDLVVSGINYGANVGINVCYSGTVAAAIEAAFYDIGAIALSLAYEDNADFEAAADHCLKVIEKLLPLKGGDVINVNIPLLSQGKPKGVKITSQGTSGFDEYYTAVVNQQGRTIYQLNGGSHRETAEGNIDVICLIEGFITVTGLHFNMTDYQKNSRLEEIDWPQPQ